ncbi:acyltransferase family protein [Paenibacillus sp. URB8-2]|uniref:acyltransferase family protein n=1 Tax=Paenibacillus sp. URB8-2 TaxID=2741301 RepID=UPI0015BF4FB0|nr:acyltransferase [Paenibacillus sp. URB8-2]BCG60046.1 acyltransferase [Paenibacillus sp. URB8-2]
MKRYHQLDSLRGLAALTVVIHHFVFIFTGWLWLEALNYTPLRILKAGHEAVIFFFVLSGFVLSLPFYSADKKVNVPHFLIKRLCRIYIPYIVAVLCSILAYLAFYRPGPDSGFSSFFHDVWSTPLSFRLIMDHIILLGSFKDYALDPVLWSLSVELRISLVFPFIMPLIKNFGWRPSAALALLLSGSSILLNNFAHPANPSPISSNLYFTLHYLSFFILGALVAKYRVNLISAVLRLSVKMKFALLLLGLIVYAYAGIGDAVFKRLFSAGGVWLSLAADWGIAFGVCILITATLSSPKISNLLGKKPVRFLGDISYSLYLYHSVALFSCIYAFHNLLPMWATLSIAMCLSLLASSLSYYFIEKPSIELGKKWTTRPPRKLEEAQEVV